jgi:hypothetical protein
MKKPIKTFLQACKALGIKPTLPVVTGLPKKHQQAIIAHYKLVIIAEALNEGWKPNWKDYMQWKYYPWFKMDSGSGLSFFVYVCDYSNSCVGSRLVFKNSDLAKYAGTTFITLYKQYYLLSK